MVSPASLHLSFESAADGGTILRVKQQQPPWRVVRGFPTPSGETLAHVHNVSGGVLATDSLSLRIDVEAYAQAQITTTGATRIYRSRSVSQAAVQHTEVEVREHAYLEYLPDQLIPFAGSRFQQTTRIMLHRDASLVWWEQIAPGREAYGESFCYESLRSGFEILAGGVPIAMERWILAPSLRPPDSVARMGPFRHFGTAYICRSSEPAAYWKNFESEMQNIAEQQSSSEILWGISSLSAGGLVIRGVSTSGRLLRDSWIEIWKSAKWRLCGRVAVVPRKVH